MIKDRINQGFQRLETEVDWNLLTPMFLHPMTDEPTIWLTLPTGKTLGAIRRPHKVHWYPLVTYDELVPLEEWVNGLTKDEAMIVEHFFGFAPSKSQFLA